MPVIIDYILKINICLAVVYIFYRLFLRRLTFYNWNRCYLLGYTALSFIIPVIDIMPSLQKSDLQRAALMQWIPVINFVPAKQQHFFETLSYWDWALGILMMGSIVLLIRFLLRFYSFKKMKAKARLISGAQTKIYQLDDPITPFSFGNAIFINTDMHPGEELKEIIRHEFVHVKQKHTIDIMWCELLCILNWFNPFVWLLRYCVKQNLEFIADNNVVQHGFNKKEYQYLLLKVMGNRQFAFTNHFNFSSLKKRIAMMNTIKTAKVHLIKFMFLLPVVAVLLLSFRKEVVKLQEQKQALNESIAAITESNKMEDLAVAFAANTLKPANSHKDTVPVKKESPSVILKGINNTDKPLIFVDGAAFPEGYDLNSINPDDIETIEVLKGESGVSLYGDKATNGVIRIKTKGALEIRSAMEAKDKHPLYIVDGKPLSGDALKEINPSKIQSVSVLKNEVYGSNLGDGIILINTKKGDDTITFSAKDSKVFLRRTFDGKLSEMQSDKIIITDDGKKILATGNVSGIIFSDIKVVADSLHNTPLKETKNIISELNGSVSGVKIVSAGQPGQNEVVVRGYPNSKTNQLSNISEDVYVVVNGKKSSYRNMKKISPDSIKTMDVLKGQKALNYYGEKAKNGAIIITTK